MRQLYLKVQNEMYFILYNSLPKNDWFVGFIFLQLWLPIHTKCEFHTCSVRISLELWQTLRIHRIIRSESHPRIKVGLRESFYSENLKPQTIPFLQRTIQNRVHFILQLEVWLVSDIWDRNYTKLLRSIVFILLLICLERLTLLGSTKEEVILFFSL